MRLNVAVTLLLQLLPQVEATIFSLSTRKKEAKPSLKGVGARRLRRTRAILQSRLESRLISRKIVGGKLSDAKTSSEKSDLGILTQSLHRSLQINGALRFFCNEPTAQVEDFFTCECSDMVKDVGSLMCLAKDVCIGTGTEVCADLEYWADYNADGSYAFRYCFNFQEPDFAYEKVCYSYESNGPACEVAFDDETCTSCTRETCTERDSGFLGAAFNCSNIVADFEGNTCNGSSDIEMLLVGTEEVPQPTLPSLAPAPQMVSSKAPVLPPSALTDEPTKVPAVTPTAP